MTGDGSGGKSMIGLRVIYPMLAAVALSGGLDRPASGTEFRGVQLGMSEKQALAQVEAIAPGAFVGPLCTGNKGVGSYLDHDGLDWQIMAHRGEGEVREIKLFRFDRAGTGTTQACQARFRRLLDEQRAKHPAAQWQTAMEEGGRHSIKGRVHTTLPDSTTVQLSVERLDWDKARCMIELLISRDGG